MKKLMLSIALATIVCAAPKAFADDTRTETPPAEPGDIYIIFHYANGTVAVTDEGKARTLSVTVWPAAKTELASLNRRIDRPNQPVPLGR